jgi:hypothetical protein
LIEILPVCLKSCLFDEKYPNLEKSKEEIIDLILAYKGTSNVYYAGHKKK